MMRNKLMGILTLMLLVALGGCAETVDSGKPQVYASFYAMAEFAEEIAGEAAEVHTLIPQGGEPHDYEPTARDLKNILNADVFVYNGNGMEGWSKDFINTVSEGKAVIVEASDGVPVKLDEADPHVWLNPDNALYEMKKIKDALVEADAENAGYYEENYQKAEKKLFDLKVRLSEFCGSNGTVIVTHPAYGYLFNALSLNQVSIEGEEEHSDPPPSRIIEIAELMKSENINCVFYEKYGSDKIAQSVAAENNAQVLPLDSFESGDGADYFEIMDANLTAIMQGINNDE